MYARTTPRLAGRGEYSRWQAEGEQMKGGWTPEGPQTIPILFYFILFHFIPQTVLALEGFLLGLYRSTFVYQDFCLVFKLA